MKRTNHIQLLDCTLRDGGYVNDWKFGRETIVSVFERMVDSGTDIIEIGFLDDRRPFDIDRSIMPNTECVNRILEGIDKKNIIVLGMIDYGTCKIENIQRCEDSYLDGIRVIFKKGKMNPALEYCRQIRELGYKVFAQLVSVTSYSDDELMELIRLVNDIRPYAVSMVDTYGLMHSEDVLHKYEILDEYLLPDIRIGFHAHNNLQLAYANGEAFLSKETDRDIVVDGTLFGMGKSAGNAPIELLAMTLNNKYGKHYDIDSMLEATKESIMSIYEQSPWGYKTFFYLSAKNQCHPKYVSYFENTHNLSITKIDRLLGEIEPEDKKLLYDENVAVNIYDNYVIKDSSERNGKKRFLNDINGRELLIIGPGKNIILQKSKVCDYITCKKPYIVSINYFPQGINTDCIFITNQKRYHDMTLAIDESVNEDIKTLATSNVECRNGEFDFVVDRVPLLENEEKIMDNSFLMLLKLLQGIGINKVSCAGFDGYSDKDDNYCNPVMEYKFVKREASHLNEHMKTKITEFRKNMKITFITYSAYDVVEDINGASI
jgi:4-hydroxy 2-oxovalerate aldolase